jgi:hypothetical protein
LLPLMQEWQKAEAEAKCKAEEERLKAVLSP